MNTPRFLPLTSSYSGMFSMPRATFLAAILVSAIAFSGNGCKRSQPETENLSVETETTTLSPATLAVLAKLSTPLEIHYYAVLDPATVPTATQTFAGRIRELLAAYQAQGNGRVILTEHTNADASARSQAAAAGMKPFNRDRGEDAYLGLTVTSQAQTEALPLLSPEWEVAVEADLTRLIARVSAPKAREGAAIANVGADPAAIQAVKETLPNLPQVTFQEGARVLKEKAITASQKATRDYADKILVAQQRFIEAEKNGSTAAQLAARNDIEQLKSAQIEAVKSITLNLDAQLRALGELKK